MGLAGSWLALAALVPRVPFACLREKKRASIWAWENGQESRRILRRPAFRDKEVMLDRCAVIDRPPFFAINQMFVSPMLNDRGREKKPGVVEATFVEERRRNHIRSRINSIGVKNVDEDDGTRVRFSRVRRKEGGERGREREDVQARALRRALKIRGRPLCLPNLEAFGISKASIRQFTSPLYPSRLMG